jgi:MoaD family protein
VIVTVKFIGSLRALSGKKQLTINCWEGISLKQLLGKMGEEYPALKRTFTDQTLNDAKSNALALVNGREISVLSGYETELNNGDEIVIVPVVHGG